MRTSICRIMIKSVALSLAALIGCGESKPTISVDAPTDIDAQMQCSTPAALSGTQVGVLNFEYTMDANPDVAGDQEEWFPPAAILNDDPKPDALYIDIIEDPEATVQDFQAPLIVDLAGPDMDPNVCSVCLALLTDLTITDVGIEEVGPIYAANGGTATFSALSSIRVTGKFENVTFRRINDDGTDANDGCTSSLDVVEFDSVPTRRGALHNIYAARSPR